MDKRFERYYKAVQFLEGLRNISRPHDQKRNKVNPEIYIKRLEFLLDLLGNPGKDIKYVHITGTSGKGSTATMVHQQLVSAGKITGLFTSPYVTTSIEKIKIGKYYIDPDEFAEIVDYIKPFLDRCYTESMYGVPSYFEIFFAITLIYFERQKCEWAVIEVGLGGRYDATNIIKNTKIAVVTNVDIDHIDVLGKTLGKIAYDKAGIIKPGCQFITAEKRPKLLNMFKEICTENGVEYRRVRGKFSSYKELNMALAKKIGAALGLNAQAINQGTKNIALPCRFEIMKNSPLVILDGAHNKSKISSTVCNIRKLNYAKLNLVIGVAEDKDLGTILAQIIPFADHIYATRFELLERDCAHPLKIIEASGRYMKKGAFAEIYLDPAIALQKAMANAGKNDLVLATGSFYMSGKLREFWYSEDYVLKKRRSF